MMGLMIKHKYLRHGTGLIMDLMAKHQVSQTCSRSNYGFDGKTSSISNMQQV